jgi:CRISPR-associated protein Cas2
MRLYVISYDIAADDRRTDVAEALRAYGRRIQYSVFECVLGDTAHAKLRTQLDGLIHHGEDQILFLDLGPLDGRAREAVTALGKPWTLPRHESVVI